MAVPKGFQLAEFGGEASDVVNAQDNPLYKAITPNWSEPIPWKRGKRSPENTVDEPCVYALLRTTAA
jgi:hypothetical protein